MNDLEEERALSGISALVRAAAEAAPAAEVHVAGRARLIEAGERLAFENAHAAVPLLGWRRGALIVAVAAGAFAGGFVLQKSLEHPLDYEVRGSESHLAQSYVSAPVAAPAEVNFSDGTRVVAAPASRLRIEETRKDGARVLVERGEITGEVVHHRDSNWFFVAGPFEVHVTGTKLSIHWDPDAERIDVTLREGSVEIESPIGPSRYAVTAGHSFHASLREKVVRMDDAPPAPAAATQVSPPDPVPPAPAETAAKIASRGGVAKAEAPEPIQTRSPETTEKGEPPHEAWSKLVRRGAFHEVVAAAEASGVTTCLATCSADDLRALADAARYTGGAALSTRALLSLRSRFGGERQGAAAAFLLGRTAESAGDLAAADKWYGVYLAESPGGEFASDALAGRMLVASRRGKSEEAAVFARDYRKRYPDGAARAVARKLAGPD